MNEKFNGDIDEPLYKSAHAMAPLGMAPRPSGFGVEDSAVGGSALNRLIAAAHAHCAAKGVEGVKAHWWAQNGGQQ